MVLVLLLWVMKRWRDDRVMRFWEAHRTADYDVVEGVEVNFPLELNSPVPTNT